MSEFTAPVTATAVSVPSTTSPLSLGEADLYKEQLPPLGRKLRIALITCCRPQTIVQKFPIISWLPRYQWSYLLQDFIAGFTVGLTTIPQAIAYGVVAGLEPQYGLYSAFMGCFTYIIFGSCKDVTIATTAIMALMVQPYASISPDYAILLCFLAGCTILLLGLCNLGVLVRFISIPVITGFTIAAAITIASAQINNLVGLVSPSKALIPSWKFFFTHLNKISRNDALLGATSLVFLLIMKKTKDISYGNRIFWKYVSLSRNACTVIIGTFLAFILSRDGSQPFRVTGNITAGLPPFRPPPFSTNVNGTTVPFTEMISTVGKIVNASQEMVALGMCNILASFVSSMPVTGSFTRTAVNNASGVKTPLGGLVTGSLVLMALAFLTQTFYYIPKSTLASIIIAAMISLFILEFRIWYTQRYNYELLISEEVFGLVTIKQKLDYASAEYVKEKIVTFVHRHQSEGINLVIILGNEIHGIDSTVAANIITLKEDLQVLNCQLLCWNWHISAAGVICRLQPEMRSIFKFNKTIEDIIEEHRSQRLSNKASQNTLYSET
uniref:SLC26A/SulP transporter domain-containing protein n=1 Tax=Glossina morsitans morsitans TaxID=37546 RepID=A0A1B0GBU3_GLOMM